MSLPNLFCVGPPKCGTTTLYDILKEHPDIFLSEIKEPGFFNDDINYSKGIGYYEKAYFGDTEGKTIIGDFSPTYFASKEAIKRIKKDIGEQVKIIVVLREPVSRAYSHYLHRVRDGIESRSFEEAMADELHAEKSVGYLSNGMFGTQLKLLVESFGKQNVLVLVFEKDIVKDIEQGISKICQFLGIKEIEKIDNKVSNPAQSPIPGMKWVRGLFHKETKLKDSIKRVMPAKQRQNIRLLFDRITTQKAKKQKDLDSVTKREMREKYFRAELQATRQYCEHEFSGWENK